MKSLFAVAVRGLADCRQRRRPWRRCQASSRRPRVAANPADHLFLNCRPAERSRSCCAPTSRPHHVERIQTLVRQRLLQRPQIPSRDPRLHGAGRRSQGNGRGRFRSARPQGRVHRRAVPARDSLELRGPTARTPPTANSSSCSRLIRNSTRITPSSDASSPAWTRSMRSRPASRRLEPTKIVHAYLGDAAPAQASTAAK